MRTGIIILIAISIALANISRDSMICFLFAGHSNMNGHCAAMDTLTNARVWVFKNGDFQHATDRDFCAFNNQSGSPVMPFLKRMALLYTGYNFCGLKMASSCAQAHHRAPGDSRYEYFTKKINELQNRVVFGGVLMMFGFIEGTSAPDVDSIGSNVLRLLGNLRNTTGERDLPCLFGRYEANGNDTLHEIYHRYDSLLIEKIEELEHRDRRFELTPIRLIPKEYFCDSHHYTADGYRIWSEDAAAVYQMNGFDGWANK